MTETEHAIYCEECDTLECVYCHDFNARTGDEVKAHALSCPDRPAIITRAHTDQEELEMIGDKRERLTGMTPLPNGNYAEHVWGSLSPAMRQVVEATHLDSRRIYGNPRTLDALARRGLARTDGHGSDGGQLSEQGVALAEWVQWMAENSPR
jgi:hypothetical protein